MKRILLEAEISEGPGMVHPLILARFLKVEAMNRGAKILQCEVYDQRDQVKPEGAS